MKRGEVIVLAGPLPAAMIAIVINSVYETLDRALSPVVLRLGYARS